MNPEFLILGPCLLSNQSFKNVDYTLNMKTQVGKKFKYYDRVYAQIFLDLASATMKSDVRLFFGYY